MKIMICENCHKEYINGYSDRFCSVHCLKSYSTKNDNKKDTKPAKCIVCGKEIQVNKRLNLQYSKCESCKSLYKKTCKICGKEFYGKQNERFCSDACKVISKSVKSLSKHFGLDLTKIGTADFIFDFNKIKHTLNSLYWDKNLSFTDICKLYNYTGNPGNLSKLFNQLGLSRRSLSESGIVSYLNGKHDIAINNHSKGIWYTTWDNFEVYLRSSYEVDFAKELDKKQIHYEVETLKIKYFDSQSNAYRCAVPDFYVPLTNTIYEIKSNWTYNKQNMDDKFTAYKALGYNCKLVLEHKEI